MATITTEFPKLIPIFILFSIFSFFYEPKKEAIKNLDFKELKEIEERCDAISINQKKEAINKGLELKENNQILNKKVKVLKTEINGLKNDLNTLNDSLVKIKEKTPKFEEKGILFWKHKDTIE
jgi:chromosome segregation ATPase